MKALGISHYTATSALGTGRRAQYAALQAERGGLRDASFETCTLPTWIGAVDALEGPTPPVPAPWDCRNNRLAEIGLMQDGFTDAIQAARKRYGADRIAVYIGTSTSGAQQAELAYRELTPEGQLPEHFNHRTTENIFSIADYIRRKFDLHGPCAAISTACSSSAKVFASAARAIAGNLVDAALVGGVDTLCLTTLYGFHSLQLLSPDICRPADAQRKGLSIGEAAGFALIENNVTAPLQLLGYGESSDAHHMSAPHPQGLGACAAMTAALERGGVEASEVDYINLHGTGTPANDLAEDKAVCTVFGHDTPCSSTKGWTGHTLGAAGILEAVLSLECLEHGLMPRSLNTRNLDPRIESAILMQSRQEPLRRVMSNSFGFGGSNCSLLFGITP
ncbi:MAG: beta-ketoacyl-[acyl-carrier-protein] synthase family protein [Sinobacteraceae bacterium]|nr:beta-ketoacyl-[acyl-carrier-protein] synthase family protein [Nevskiaceae bacterium]